MAVRLFNVNYIFLLFDLDIKAEKRRKSEEVDPMDPSSYSDAPRYFSIEQNRKCYGIYYISKLVRALWLANLAVRTLLHEPLKLVAKLFRDLSPNFLNLYGK